MLSSAASRPERKRKPGWHRGRWFQGIVLVSASEAWTAADVTSRGVSCHAPRCWQQIMNESNCFYTTVKLLKCCRCICYAPIITSYLLYLLNLRNSRCCPCALSTGVYAQSTGLASVLVIDGRCYNCMLSWDRNWRSRSALLLGIDDACAWHLPAAPRARTSWTVWSVTSENRVQTCLIRCSTWCWFVMTSPVAFDDSNRHQARKQDLNAG